MAQREVGRPMSFALSPPEVQECEACLERHRRRGCIVVGWDEKYVCLPCLVSLRDSLSETIAQLERQK